MKSSIWAKLLSIPILLVTVNALSQEATLQCDIGPATREFGGYEWLIYSCSDNATIVVVSAPGNPAMPFYFSLSPDGDGYRLLGEGNGDQSVTQATSESLAALSLQDIAELIEATKK